MLAYSSMKDACIPFCCYLSAWNESAVFCARTNELNRNLIHGTGILREEASWQREASPLWWSFWKGILNKKLYNIKIYWCRRCYHHPQGTVACVNWNRAIPNPAVHVTLGTWKVCLYKGMANSSLLPVPLEDLSTVSKMGVVIFLNPSHKTSAGRLKGREILRVIHGGRW